MSATDNEHLSEAPSAARWLLWAIVALVSWGVWAIISKLMGDALSAAQSQALSTVGILPVMIALYSLRKRENPVRESMSAAGARRGIAYALGAGVLACLGNIAYYHALNVGGKASTVIPLTSLYPLVTVILALVFLKERLNRIQRFGVLFSLAAIYLLNVQTDRGLVSAWLVYALVPIAVWGMAGLLQKLSTNTLSGERSTFWFLATFVPVALVILVLEPWPGFLGAKIWLLVLALGLFFALGNYGILAAFAAGGKASVITPLTGLYPVVSVPIAIVFLGERIGARETIGISLALISVVALSYEERAGRPAENMPET